MDTQYARVRRELAYPLTDIQFVVPIRCGDARDGSALETEILDTLTLEYASRGVKVRLARVNMAGSVINPASYVEIKNILKNEIRNTSQIYNGAMVLRNPSEGQVLFKPTIQISGHASLSIPETNNKLTYSPADVSIADEHSPVNCGMAHAGEVWRQLVTLLITLRPEVDFFDKEKRKFTTARLVDEEVLCKLLSSAYLFDGKDVSQFLTNIDLIHQPLESKAYLRSQFDRDLELVRVPAHINASLIDYGKGCEVRIDDNEDVHTVLDDLAAIKAYVVSRLPDDHPEKKRRASPQKPICGIICPSDIQNPRDMVINYLNLGEKKAHIDVAGSAFLTTGYDIYNQFAAFGPYKMGGIAYSVVELGITDYYVVGKTPLDADLIEIKIQNDPILSTVFHNFGVKIKKLTIPQIEAAGIQKHSNNVDRDVLDLIGAGIRDFHRHDRSVLNRPVKEPRVRELLRGA